MVLGWSEEDGREVRKRRKNEMRSFGHIHKVVLFLHTGHNINDVNS